MAGEEIRPIQNAETIIERFGGIRPMATKTNIPVTTIQGWKKRNAIPAARRTEILKAAQDHNIDIADILSAGAVNENNTTQNSIQNATVISMPAREEKSSYAPAPAGVMPSHANEAQPKPRGMNTALWGQAGLAVVALVAVGVLLWPKSPVPVTVSEVELAEREPVSPSFMDEILPKDLGEKIENLSQQAMKVAGQAEEQIGVAMEKAGEISQDVLAENAGTLEDRVARLQTHLTEIISNPAMQNLWGDMQSLQSSVLGQQQLDQASTELSVLMEQFTGTTDQISPYLDEARNKSTVLSETFEEVPAEDMKAAALLFGLNQFRGALSRDKQPFEQDLALMKNLVGTENAELMQSIDRLAPQAKDGVLTVSGLSNEFRGLAGEIVVASLSGEDVSVQEKATARLNDLFSVQKDGELVTGTETQAKVARTMTHLDQNNLGSAVAEIKTLEGPAATKAAPWLAEAEKTLATMEFQKILDQALGFNPLAGVDGGPATNLTQVPGQGFMIEDKDSGLKVYKPAPDLSQTR